MSELDSVFLKSLKSDLNTVKQMMNDNPAVPLQTQQRLFLTNMQKDIQEYISGYEKLKEAGFSDYEAISTFAKGKPISADNIDDTKAWLLENYSSRVLLLQKYTQALQLFDAGKLGIMQ